MEIRFDKPVEETPIYVRKFEAFDRTFRYGWLGCEPRLWYITTNKRDGGIWCYPEERDMIATITAIRLGSKPDRLLDMKPYRTAKSFPLVVKTRIQYLRCVGFKNKDARFLAARLCRNGWEQAKNI